VSMPKRMALLFVMFLRIIGPIPLQAPSQQHLQQTNFTPPMVDVSFMSGALDNFLISRMNDLLLSETNQIKGAMSALGQKRT
jgi:hypothetical protein